MHSKKWGVTKTKKGVLEEAQLQHPTLCRTICKKNFLL